MGEHQRAKCAVRVPCGSSEYATCVALSPCGLFDSSRCFSSPCGPFDYPALHVMRVASFPSRAGSVLNALRAVRTRRWRVGAHAWWRTRERSNLPCRSALRGPPPPSAKERAILISLSLSRIQEQSDEMHGSGAFALIRFAWLSGGRCWSSTGGLVDFYTAETLKNGTQAAFGAAGARTK